MGFELNDYNLCVANKTIEGLQYSVAFYFDDNKISHKNPKVVDSIITALEKKFGGITYSIGKHHDFLGMDIEYNDNKIVSIRMRKRIEEAIDWFGGYIVPKATPFLFNIGKDLSC